MLASSSEYWDLHSDSDFFSSLRLNPKRRFPLDIFLALTAEQRAATERSLAQWRLETEMKQKVDIVG
jgi:hypothetical protein